MQDETIIKRISDIRTNIRNLKTNQVIGGDSWVVYRTAMNFTYVPNHKYRVDFVPDTDGTFVAKAYETTADRFSSTDYTLVPDPNYSGRWYFYRYANENFPIVIFIYSTKKGIITVTDVT